MSGKQDNAARVSVFALVVAALTGFFVLFIQGEARGGEASADELAEVFATRQPLSEVERLEAAEAVLRRDRQQRVKRLSVVVLESGWKLWNTTTPRGAVSQAGRLFRGVRDFRDNDAAIESAIQMLEPAVELGSDGVRLEALYQDLRASELEERLDARLKNAEDATNRGDLNFARILIERSLEQAPDNARANLLEAELNQLLIARRVEPDPVYAEIEGWEAALAGAMLTGDYDRVLAAEVDTPEAELAQATARYLFGDEGSALSDFDALGGSGGVTGIIARDFLASPELNPEVALKLASDDYRRRKWLGRIGGSELSDARLALSTRELRRWSDAASGSIALGAPLRTWQGWTPDQSELLAASQRYLNVLPDGEQADDAEKWLQKLEASRLAQSPGWDDGRLQLPRARTEFSSLAPRPIVVTASVFDSEWLSGVDDLRSVLGQATALELRPIRGTRAALEGVVLSADRARGLIDELASALEQRGLQPHDISLAQVLEALRVLDASLANDYQVEVVAWEPQAPGTLESIKLAALEGDAESATGIAIASGRDDLKGERSFGRASFRCPKRQVCIDRERLLNGTLYSKIELDADFKLGARTGFNRASVALEVGSRGPQASLVVPIGDWLRLNRWIPVEARFSFGLDGMEFGPSFQKDPNRAR